MDPASPFRAWQSPGAVLHNFGNDTKAMPACLMMSQSAGQKAQILLQ
jgi:hypothetical protein